MPPKQGKKPTAERLQTEVNEMESIMAMLRGQIDEERAKVQPNRTRWAAAAEGPISKFDAHGELARKILSKKKPVSAAARASPRRSQVQENPPIEITVEPQAGKLWGQYTDSEFQPDDGEVRGGTLWGPPPNEAENARTFREQVAKMRGEVENDEEEGEEEEGQRVSTGGALWGPPPDELEEQAKFQREVARFRGEPPPVQKIENGEQGVGGTIVEAKKKSPTAFTYFDFLVTRDILDGSSHLQSMTLKD